MTLLMMVGGATAKIMYDKVLVVEQKSEQVIRTEERVAAMQAQLTRIENEVRELRVYVVRAVK